MGKRRLLGELTVGRRVAEEEVHELAGYFVETDPWRQVITGEADVVFGPKGSGKSAIYSSLLNREATLADQGILLVSAENPSGAAAFRGLVVDPPTGESEFIALWKLYTLVLVGRVLFDYGLGSDEARLVLDSLRAEDLLPAKASLSGVISNVFTYIKRALRPESVEASAKLDPASGITLSAKIALGDPSPEDKRKGLRSIDDLLTLASMALAQEQLSVWVLFDRLDVAFAESRQLEANALRALFKVYLDIPSNSAVKLKLFLRSDIWSEITQTGFRELSHIERSVTLAWSDAALLRLVVQRLLQNDSLVEAFGIERDVVLASSDEQRLFFDRLVPEQVDTGRNPKTFEWLLGRVRDGSKSVAPRELIHLLAQAREKQLAMLETGSEEPTGEMLFTRQALREALPEVSRVRLTQTLYAEYPGMQTYLQRLEEEKTEQTPESLSRIWNLDEAAAQQVATRLVEIGFFERRGDKNRPAYWVPFLYRPALRLVQGSADTDQPGADGGDVDSLTDGSATDAKEQV